MEKHLHIITHELPWPADYGGRMDLYYKITALSRKGILLHLHAFSKELPTDDFFQKMKAYCTEVNVYPRKGLPSPKDILLPYIISSRNSSLLLSNILKDRHPVLLEGLHCSYLLHSGALQDRKVILRAHNVEFIYYRQLAEGEPSFLRRLYFQVESQLLKKYEKKIIPKLSVLCVSELDRFEYHRCFGKSDAFFLPVFTGFRPDPPTGMGQYALYHGNLSVNENIRAVEWLAQEVYGDEDLMPLVIAGRNPSNAFKNWLNKKKNIRLVENPSDEEMETLIKEAHVHLLPSMNRTGVKLKLLHALNMGRFVICNEACSKGSGVESLCLHASDGFEWKALLKDIIAKEFTEKLKQERIHVLSSVYDNESNADQLIRWIY